MPDVVGNENVQHAQPGHDESASPGHPGPAASERRRNPVGPARVLALGYGFFTLAAGARSGVQLAQHPSRAPLAYLLSAVAAAIYLSGMVLIIAAEQRLRWRMWAVRLCVVELAGVLVVGSTSALVPVAFPDATVWSWYGSGYGFVPTILPVLALCWLHARPAQPPNRRESQP